MRQGQRRRPLVFRFFINYYFQIKYILMVVALTGISTVVFGYLYYRNEVAKSEILSLQNANLAQWLHQSDYTVLWYVLAFVTVQCLVLVFAGLYFTHRIAGPIERIKRYFSDVIVSGEFQEFDRVRSRDEFQDFFEIIRDFNAKFLERQEQHRSLVNSLDQLAHSINSDKLTELVTQMKRH